MLKNNYFKLLTLLVSLFYIAGCSSIRSIKNYAPSINYNKNFVQNYTVGKEKKIYIGENIIEKGNIIYKEITSGEFKAIKDVGAYIYRDHIYKVIYIDKKDNSYYIKYGNNRFGVRIDHNGFLLDNHMFYYNIGGWQNHLGHSLGVNVGEKVFEPLNNTIKTEKGSFKIEIIYSGLDENNLKATYREYKDDVARPAFYQDLVYNLNKSKYIRYKKFKIQVLNATNEELDYIVLEDGQ